MNDYLRLKEFIEERGLNGPIVRKLWRMVKDEGFEATVEYYAGIDIISGNSLRASPLPFPIWGEKGIQPEAVAQMEMAMRLPVSIAGALMADAHLGYGLPIGGVLAVKNAIIPYAVGVDIGCSVHLTIFREGIELLENGKTLLRNALIKHTAFGKGAKLENPPEDEILQNYLWDSTKFLKNLKPLAAQQLGSSGGGNHFVEWGEFEYDSSWEKGKFGTKYLALMSHSGSRAVGMSIANHYSKLASQMHPELPKEFKHLAWLEFGKDGLAEEYEEAMILAGMYATANHRAIHHRIGDQLITSVRNNFSSMHNYASREPIIVNGEWIEALIHRKGATPAHDIHIGIIPGSMESTSYLVTGLSNKDSLFSASHGAGRKMSRRQAMKEVTMDKVRKRLIDNGIDLIGGDADESPEAYKNIEEVMNQQKNLVRIIGRFQPRIVRMADDGSGE